MFKNYIIRITKNMMREFYELCDKRIQHNEKYQNKIIENYATSIDLICNQDKYTWYDINKYFPDIGSTIYIKIKKDDLFPFTKNGNCNFTYIMLEHQSNEKFFELWAYPNNKSPNKLENTEVL